MTESSLQALSVLRSTENMQWYVVPLIVIVAYIYITEIEKGNLSAVYLGICTWAAELIWEMFNAGILHFSQYAPLWCTPGKSAYILYTGLNIEIEFFFAVMGLIVVKSLPKNAHLRIAGIPNRLFIPILLGLLCVFVEILLNQAGLLIWEYTWWGWPHIWLIVFVYCAPWLAVAWCHDHLSMKTKARFALILPAAALCCHLIFATALGWI